MQGQILCQHKWRDQKPKTRKWLDQTQFMKGIKNITNKITKTKDSVSKVISYSHLSKVISCFLDGPKTKGKPIIFKKKGGPQNRRQLMFVKKEKKPQNTKGGTHCSKKKKKGDEIMR